MYNILYTVAFRTVFFRCCKSNFIKKIKKNSISIEQNYIFYIEIYEFLGVAYATNAPMELRH